MWSGSRTVTVMTNFDTDFYGLDKDTTYFVMGSDYEQTYSFFGSL